MRTKRFRQRSPWLVLVLLWLGTGCGGADRQDARETSGAGAPEQARDTLAGHDGAAPAPGEGWTVGFSRYGPVPLGVPLAEAAAASSGGLRAPEDPAGCSMVGIDGAGEEVWLMIVEGRVVRVDVEDPAVPTERGAKVGDSEDRILELYGEALEVQPHKYTDGHYLVVTPPAGGAHRLIFETDGDRVLRYRAGAMPQVAWVERCG